MPSLLALLLATSRVINNIIVDCHPTDQRYLLHCRPSDQQQTRFLPSDSLNKTASSLPDKRTVHTKQHRRNDTVNDNDEYNPPQAKLLASTLSLTRTDTVSRTNTVSHTGILNKTSTLLPDKPTVRNAITNTSRLREPSPTLTLLNSSRHDTNRHRLN